MNLKKEIIALYKKTATELPSDIIIALERAMESENSVIGKKILEKILENVYMAKDESKPICQDTGTPVFYITCPKSYSKEEIRGIVDEATKIATEEIPLRPNSVDVLTGKNIGNKPIIYFEETERFRADLLLKGGGSENVSAIYQLPNPELGAHRDISGVEKCVLDAIFKAQGRGCPPYIIGVGIGGSIEEVAHISKKQLLRKIEDENPIEKLKYFEEDLLTKINQLSIGPLGLGGRTTSLGIKATTSPRHPASFFVGISIGCWCLRRQSIAWWISND